MEIMEHDDANYPDGYPSMSVITVNTVERVLDIKTAPYPVSGDGSLMRNMKRLAPHRKLSSVATGVGPWA